MTQKDHEFYEDQKGPRNAKCLSSVDPLTSSDYRFQRRVQEKQHESCVELFDESCSSSADIEVVSSDCDNTSLSFESSSATLFGISQPSQQNRSNWPNLAKIAERFQISDRAAAALANAVLKDVGLVTENDKKLVIDKNKLRRERQKYREDIRQNQSKFFHMINGVYVDGRKDATLITSQLDNGKSYQSMHLEEHYVMVGEPGEYYLTHFGTANGKGCSIADGIFSAIKDTELQEKLEVIGSDGAATMTGVNSGCIRTLEVLLKRPLQWVVCLLHTNELPLRHIFQYLDGGTKSPNAFAGPIGKSLDSNSSQWPVITFKPILNPYFPTLPNEVLEELSTDQYYGYRICWAVICGEVDEDLKLLEIGPIVHSRWLTLACRILRLYTATCNPSQSLVTLAEYCLKVYFPTWFEISWLWDQSTFLILFKEWLTFQIKTWLKLVLTFFNEMAILHIRKMFWLPCLETTMRTWGDWLSTKYLQFDQKYQMLWLRMIILKEDLSSQLEFLTIHLQFENLVSVKRSTFYTK